MSTIHGAPEHIRYHTDGQLVRLTCATCALLRHDMSLATHSERLILAGTTA